MRVLELSYYLLNISRSHGVYLFVPLMSKEMCWPFFPIGHGERNGEFSCEILKGYRCPCGRTRLSPVSCNFPLSGSSGKGTMRPLMLWWSLYQMSKSWSCWSPSESPKKREVKFPDKLI